MRKLRQSTKKRYPPRHPPALMTLHHPFKSRPGRARRPLAPLCLAETRVKLARLQALELRLALAGV